MVSSDFDLGGFEKPETVFVKKEWRNCKPDHKVFPYNETRVELRRR